MSFASLANNAQTTLAANYTAGSGTVTLASGYGATLAAKITAAGFASIAPTAPLRFTLIAASAINTYGQISDLSRVTILEATGLAGDVLSGVTAVEGTTDQNFSAGDTFAVLLTAGQIQEMQAAIVAGGGGGGGGGTVTTVSVVSANGFAGTVANAATTPAITLKTTITGLLKGNGTAIAAAIAGTDYLAPTGNGSGLTGLTESQIANLTTDLAACEKTANKGQANGYASLDSGGKVPTSQLPASVLGAVEYQGTWDASANSPALASGVGTKGYYYKVSVAGNTTLDGNTGWHVGDWVVFDGTAWEKIDNYEAVTSVFGRTGAITANTGDYTAAQVTNAVDQTGSYANPAWISSLASSKITGSFPESQVTNLTTDLAAKAPLASPSFTGTVTIGTLTGLLKAATGAVSTATEGTDYLSGASNKLPLPFSFGGSGTPSVANDVCPWLYVPYAATANRLTLTCLTAPTGNFTVTVKRSADGGSTFPDTIATVTVGSGAREATTTTMTNAALAAGDLLRCDITAVNGAATWTARLGALSRNQ